MINGRRQVLLQDDITASSNIMWRMHTNATVNLDPNNPTSATLVIGQQSLQMQILSPTSGVKFETMDANRLPTDPPLPAGAVDQDNPGVVVVMINMQPGTKSLQVLFNPQWDGMSASDFKTPPAVPLSQWTLTSHDS